MPSRITSIGSGTPMTPVEQTSTCSSEQPRHPATSAVIRLAFSMPGKPVAAFEFPEFMITARTFGAGTRERDTVTGAPQTRF